MKNYVLFLFIIISNLALGQDTTSVKNDIILNLSGIHPGINTQNTTTIIKNTYALNQSEKDSVWQNVYFENNTQSLFKNFKQSKSNELYQPQNLLQLMAILNTDFVDYKIKRNLLIGKITFDKEQANDNDNPYQVFGRCGLGERPKIEEISSKKDALQDYISAYKNQKNNFFQIPTVAYIGVDYKKPQPIVAASIFKKEQTTYQKTIKYLHSLHIKRVEIAYGLTVYYEKK